MKIILGAILVLSCIPFVFAQEYSDLGVKVEIVAENLKIPWSIAWAPDGTIFFTERDGHLRTIQDGIVSERFFQLMLVVSKEDCLELHLIPTLKIIITSICIILTMTFCQQKTKLFVMSSPILVCLKIKF